MVGVNGSNIRFSSASLCTLHVEYAEQRLKYSILCIFIPVYVYSNLNMNMFLSNTGFTGRNTAFIL